jgi:stage V sporulation protein K
MCVREPHQAHDAVVRFVAQEACAKGGGEDCAQWQAPSTELAVNDIMAPFAHLVGLHAVRKIVEEVCAHAVVRKWRRAAQLQDGGTVQNMIFSGRPGTGKTSVARALADAYRRLGVLSQGQLVEVERADLVGEYVGHTAQKTRQLLARAHGGILFVDEAYALAHGGERDFGREALTTLVKGVEEGSADRIVILAGYTREMESLLQLNPGLRSRFPIQLTFADYTLAELGQIALAMLRERDYVLEGCARDVLLQRLRTLALQPDFANGRTVRNLLEGAIRRHALRVSRLCSPTRSELMTITVRDVLEARCSS